MPLPLQQPASGLPRPPYNPALRGLIEGKRQRHYQPDRTTAQQGFLGWHERGYVPHFDAPHVTQFVTFMLHDAFPVARKTEWECLLKEPDDSLRRRQIEAWLDRGHGDCWLGRREVAEVVDQTLQVDDGDLCRLRAWVVMPNHIHLVVDVWDQPLSHLMKLWKGRSARRANRLLDRTGTFWEREYFDTLIKDDTHLARAVRYTENNPTKARFVHEPREWRWSSARHRDAHARLPSERASIGTPDLFGR